MKGFISGILTFIVCAACFLYTYSSYDLPFRERAFEVTSEDGSITSMHEMSDIYWRFKDTPVDASADLRSRNIIISGEFKIGEIKQDGNCFQIISEYKYFDFGKMPMLYVTDEYYKPDCRKLVVYFPADSINLYDCPVGSKIKFKAKFNNINKTYIICTDGEVVIC